MAGLYSLSVIAEFLGQKPEDMNDRIKLDGLPVIQVPGNTRPIRKVALLAFHAWLCSRSTNAALTVEQLATEMERCEESVLRKHQIKAQRAKLKKEQNAAPSSQEVAA